MVQSLGPGPYLTFRSRAPGPGVKGEERPGGRVWLTLTSRQRATPVSPLTKNYGPVNPPSLTLPRPWSRRGGPTTERLRRLRPPPGKTLPYPLGISSTEGPGVGGGEDTRSPRVSSLTRTEESEMRSHVTVLPPHQIPVVNPKRGWVRTSIKDLGKWKTIPILSS